MNSIIYVQKFLTENPMFAYDIILIVLLLVSVTINIVLLIFIKRGLSQRDVILKLQGGFEIFSAQIHVTSKLLKKIDARVKKIEKEINTQSRDITDNKYELLKSLSDLRKSLSDLRVETIDAQTAKYKVNEAIRMAMGDQTETDELVK